MDNVSRVERGTRVSPWNLPNALTVLRLILVPVFIFLKFQDSWTAQWWAVAVFCIAGTTDHLDGKLARARGLITDFGRIVDPIADKALTLGAFIILSWEGLLPWWFTVLIAARELGVTALRAVLLRRDIVVSANWGGKIKTVVQMLAIFLLLIPWAYFVERNPANYTWAVYANLAALVVAGAALAATLWTGIDYALEGIRLMRQSTSRPDSDEASLPSAERGSEGTAASVAAASKDETSAAEGAEGAEKPAPAENAEESVMDAAQLPSRRDLHGSR